MKVLLFGATGMLGQAALQACLADPRVTQVLAVGRRATGQSHPKLRDLVVADLADLGPVQDHLEGFDACLWCLGVSSVGMAEADYRRVTHDYTLAAARLLARTSPDLAFCFVSGAGTDAKGKSMWARVKGATEDEVRALFPHTYLFRPGFIQPRDGITSRTGWYRAFYAVGRVLYPVLPGSVATDTRRFGRAMVEAAAQRGPSRVLESKDINALGAA